MSHGKGGGYKGGSRGGGGGGGFDMPPRASSSAGGGRSFAPPQGGQGNFSPAPTSNRGGGGYGAGAPGSSRPAPAPPSSSHHHSSHHSSSRGGGGGSGGGQHYSSSPGPSSSRSGGGGSTPPLSISGCNNATVSNIIKGYFLPEQSNHGKPVYRKQTSGGGVQVLIYYWDDRDGPSFSGWWLGPKVGGDQVWAYNSRKEEQMPPSSGWKVPWDGPVDESLRIVPASGGGGGGGGGSSMSERDSRGRQEEDRRRREEDDRRRAEERRREEDRRRRDEEARRRQKEREEEERRYQAEQKRKREEEEALRRREQAAAMNVRKVIQRLRSVTPETYEAMRTELEEAQAMNASSMGSQAEKISQEADKALVQAQERVEDIKRQREEEERARIEEEKRRKVEAEKIERLLGEARDCMTSVDEKVKSAQETATKVIEDKNASPEEMVASSEDAEKSVSSARDVCNSAMGTLLDKRRDMGDSDQSYKAKRELGELQQQLNDTLRTLDVLSQSLSEMQTKASKKGAALKKLAEREAAFNKADGDGDSKLSKEEVVDFAKSEYDFDVPAEIQDKIMKVLDPITLEKFQRVRAMITVARSEILAREKRAAEAEKRRILEEQKLAVQKLVDDAHGIFQAAELTLQQAEDKAKPITKGTDLPAEEMKATAAAIETMVKKAEEELKAAMAKVQQVEDDCAANEDMKGYDRRDVPGLKERNGRLEGRIEKVVGTAKAAVEKSVRKAFAEQEERRSEVLSAMRKFMHAENKSAAELFEHVAGGDTLPKDKFVAFVGKLPDLKFEEGQTEALFDHMAGKAEAGLPKEQFLESIRLYYKVVRSTVLTEEIAIKSKTLARLVVGDVLEALGAPSKEEGANVERVRCMSVQDETTGWVTIAGNQGTPFLEPGGNLMTVIKETALTDGLSVNESKIVRKLAKGEVVEVLEFAKKDESVGVKRIKGRAKLDGVTGWVTISGNQGTSFLETC